MGWPASPCVCVPVAFDPSLCPLKATHWHNALWGGLSDFYAFLTEEFDDIVASDGLDCRRNPHLRELFSCALDGTHRTRWVHSGIAE